MRMIVPSALLAVILAGCASHSGVVPMGSGTFMISKQAATGFSGLGSLKAEVYQEASARCSRDGKGLQTTTYNESRPPYILGNFPRVELSFRCE